MFLFALLRCFLFFFFAALLVVIPRVRKHVCGNIKKQEEGLKIISRISAHTNKHAQRIENANSFDCTTIFVKKDFSQRITIVAKTLLLQHFVLLGASFFAASYFEW